jgi:glycoprotein endo-alpha-1,2-mannosidase
MAIVISFGGSPVIMLGFGIFLSLVLSVAGDSAQSGRSNPHVHAFYYLWYGNIAHDGRWIHWDHAVLPHWTQAVRNNFPENVNFIPPHDIHAPYYPARGLYSTGNVSLIAEHFKTMRTHGIGVAAVSWWGRPEISAGDSQGIVTDKLISRVLEAALEADILVAFHLEPYPGRSISSIRDDISYLQTQYGSHSAIYRLPVRKEESSQGESSTYSAQGNLSSQSEHARTVYYVYDSYHIPNADWQSLLQPTGSQTVRGTALDGFFVGLWLNQDDGKGLVASGFDGAYTYFGTDGFTYASTIANWGKMVQFAKKHNMFFAPCVSPGYDDTRIRPWNAANRRERDGGEYYKRMWRAALGAEASYVAITSFNEWGEGTQIEEAVPRSINVPVLAARQLALPPATRNALYLHSEYKSYLPERPNYYMMLTLNFSSALADYLGHPALAQNLRKTAEGRQQRSVQVFSLPDDESKPDKPEATALDASATQQRDEF